MKIPSFVPSARAACLAAALMMLAPLVARADFFKYKDDSGALIITNRFEDIPKKYHKRVKVTWDKDLEARDPLAKRQAAAREQYEQRESARTEQQEPKQKKQAKKGQTLVIEMDETTGEVKRRFE